MRPALARPALARYVHLLAILATALLCGPALAHLFELPNKMALDRADYLVVQQIYAGWSLFGIAVIIAFLATLALLLLRRRPRLAQVWIWGSLLCQVAAQAIFWTVTWPANQQTANWTRLPDTGWEALRQRWEWAHAGGAVLTFGAVTFLVIALLVCNAALECRPRDA